jgi:hypothetical protein
LAVDITKRDAHGPREVLFLVLLAWKNLNELRPFFEEAPHLPAADLFGHPSVRTPRGEFLAAPLPPRPARRAL